MDFYIYPLLIAFVYALHTPKHPLLAALFLVKEAYHRTDVSFQKTELFGFYEMVKTIVDWC